MEINSFESLLKTKLLFWYEVFLEKIKIFFNIYKIELFFYVLIMLILILLTKLPYINVFIGKEPVVFLSITLAVWLFKITWKRLLIFTFMLFILSLLFTLFAKGNTAESLGNQIYFLLWIVAIMYCRKLWKEL